MSVDSLNSRHFEAKDIKKLLDIDKNKLFYWIKTHRLLKPEVEEASGTGTRAKFSLKNLLELATVKELLNLGFDLNSIKKIKTKMNRYKIGNENIFNEILEDEDRAERALFIYRSKDKIFLYLQTYDIGGDADVSDGIVSYYPVREPDYAQWDWSINKERPPTYGGVILHIGILTSDLIEKVEKL